MTARSPSALALSAVLHTAVVVAFLIIAYLFKDDAVKATRDFILVQGEGVNYGATEAPALGTPGGGKVEFQPSPAPVVAPQPAPPVVEPQPVAPPGPPPMIAVASPPARTAATVPASDFAKQIKSVERRTETKLVAKFVAEQKKKAEADAKAAELERKKLTYEEFLKQQGGKTTPTATATNSPLKTPRIDAQGIAKGVMGGSTANTTGGAGGKALTTEEGDLLGKYFALLKQSLQQAHEKPMGVSDLLHATVEFHVAADGSLSQVRVVRSSGNNEFDQSVLAAFRSVHSIGLRPDHQGSTVQAEFRMKEDD